MNSNKQTEYELNDKEHNFWPTPGSGPVPVSSKVDFPAIDHAVFDLWKEHNVFLRTISERPLPGKDDFVAYDGPPGTNGTPHIGHMMQSALKDLWPRYKTMRGHRVLRKAGWDTHGLPIELTAEKELGLKSKRDIAAYGVDKYIEYCRSTVFRYKKSWEEAIHRIGRFLDTDNDYATLNKEYIETDWWVIKQAWDKELLYQDRRIMPYCCRCGTSLSQHEVAQGYKDVHDISLYAKFRVGLEAERRFLVAWTTTPWTLLSNVALAVNPDLTYVEVEVESGDRLIIAEARLDTLKQMLGNYTIREKYSGSGLAGCMYEPLWNFQYDDFLNVSDDRPAIEHWHHVVADDYVTADDGTGIVHLALYGADDFRLIRKHNIPEVQNVDLDGNVTHHVDLVDSQGKPFAGRWFREEGLDVDILKDLLGRGLLFGKEKITHSYPHCYRCDTPLMYFAKSGWFLRTSALKEEMLKANQTINWYPEHIKEGRFGNWLENNVDWNISRDRYWGSPLPIWTCECGKIECFESLAALNRRLKSPLPAGFDPHKPYIDKIELECAKCGKKMKRTPEVLDCWFNAGIMPWGQWGYPAVEGSQEIFAKQFPADFICEAIDQTRGWFYTMLATSVLITTKKVAPTSVSGSGGVEKDRTDTEVGATGFIGGVSSFKNVICTEHISDADGQKMSKSRGNVVDPIGLCEKYGADAVRWSFYNVNPWTARRFAVADLSDVLKQVLIPYWNCYSFFVTYARVDGWKPNVMPAGTPALQPVNPLDRWILSRLEGLKEEVTGGLEGYDVGRAAQAFTEFLDELTNWYIRRSRRRFWKSEDDDDKQWAYKVLHHVLTTVNRMLAPFLPFVSEVVYQNIERGYDALLPDSIHLSDWPESYPDRRDFDLEKQMEQVRQVVTLARSLRADYSVRVRQPLRELVVAGFAVELGGDFEELILDELNIKALRRVDDASELFHWQAKGDMKSLGPKYGARMKEVLSLVAGLDHIAISKLLEDGKLEVAGLTLVKEDLLLSQQATEGYWVRSEGSLTVGISNRLDQELTDEWLAREFVHHVQNLRREADLDVTDRIWVEYTGSEEVVRAVRQCMDYIKLETLAASVSQVDEGCETAELKIGDYPGRIRIRAHK